MPVFQRATMPENFYDITSDMLLAQPEPQFLYAQLMLAAMAAQLDIPGAFGITPDRSVGGAGAVYSAAERDRLFLSNPLSGEIFATSVDFKGKAGTTIRVNRPAYTNSTYTLGSRTVASGATIATTPITVSSQQNNLTLQRFAGPYDNAAAQVRPYGVDRFDASVGVHRAASLFGTHLKRDYHRFLDAAWVSLFDLASTAVYPEGMTAPNDATAAGQYPFTLEQLFRVETAMDTANLPTFGDGFRAIVLTPTQLNQLRNNAQYQRLATLIPEYNSLFPQYVGSVGKLHIFKSTTLNVTNNSSSVPIHYGHAIAPGAAMSGMGEPPRVASSTDDNFGETPKFVWLAYLAFALANNSFVLSVRSSG